MTDNLLAPTHEIIRCCDALLSEAEGKLNEKQRYHIESIRVMAGDQRLADDHPSGLLSGFNWFALQTDAEDKERRAVQELGYFVRTPLAAIRAKVYVLLRLGEKSGNLNDNQQAYVKQIQRCTDQIQDELNRIWAESG